MPVVSPTAHHAHEIPDRTERAPAPEELYLEITNRCNLRCRTCPQFFGMAERFHDMSWQRFLEITDQFLRLRRVVLHGIGEPLLHAELGRMIRHLKSRGAYVLFNSNGLLLRGRKAADLAASGLDELRISIDGGTPETYRTVRGVDGFDRILGNIRRFEEVKRSSGTATPSVSLWVTGMKTTMRDLPDLVRVAAACGVREVYLQRLVYSDRGIATEAQSLYGKDAPEERAAVAEAVRLAAVMGVTLRGSGELGPEALVDHPQPGDAPWRGCHRPWRLMYVTANGSVLPCCIAPFTATPYGQIVLGDLNQTSAAEVWDGDHYRAWRRAMLDGEPPAPCAGCGVSWSL
ncbi:MAG: radical SAM/SPASM domain-containing protein [Dehalococcoidia bacterium]